MKRRTDRLRNHRSSGFYTSPPRGGLLPSDWTSNERDNRTFLERARRNFLVGAQLAGAQKTLPLRRSHLASPTRITATRTETQVAIRSTPPGRF